MPRKQRRLDMFKRAITAVILAAGICAFVAPTGRAAIMSPMTSDAWAVLSGEAGDAELILVRARGAGRTNVNRNANVNRNINRNANVHRNVHRNANVDRNVNVNRNVNRNVNVNRGVVGVGARGVAVVRPIRPWVARPYYGRVIAGVTLGTIIAATAVAVVPAAPAPSLCWYWADPPMTQGYWDYCK
jgi:hypothetical protein